MLALNVSTHVSSGEHKRSVQALRHLLIYLLADRAAYQTVAKFYKSTTDFSCISNPLHKIPVSQVNDDYCDCPDGSDEPGTSACSYLSPLSPQQPSTDLGLNLTPALPGFYCKNKGHIPSYLPFTSVNDGRCDYTLCCDGTDEWASVGGTSCPDRCKEIGKEWRKQDEARKKAHGAAMRRRKDLVTEATRLQTEVEKRIETLQAEVEAKEVQVHSAEKVLEDAEKADKLRVVHSGGAGGGGRTSVLANLAKNRVEELRSSLISVRSQRDAVSNRLGELEQLFVGLQEAYNPNFNDEGVKRTVRAWEEYVARDKEGDWEAAQDRDLDEITKPDGENDSGINWMEWETDASAAEAQSDVAVLYRFSAYLPPSLRGWIEEKITSIRRSLVENGILVDNSDGSATNSVESKAVVDARNAVNIANSELSNAKRDLTTHESDLEKDYGPDSIFRALQGTCISKDAGEYTYELCFLQQTKQKPKKGGGDTNMGNFARLDREFVDEEVGADGKGVGRGERISMRYENGQQCWNGPSRSTLVVLGCAEKEEIWKISESEKCVYRMEVGTTAVCGVEFGQDEDEGGGGGGIRRDEL